MRTGSSRQAFFDTWVDGVARNLHDPVERLRFVRVAVPCKPLAPRMPKSARAIPSAVAVLLFLLLAAATAYLAFHEHGWRI